MNILVINGSPKGKLAVTAYHAQFFKEQQPEHRWEVVHVGKRIKGIERSDDEFNAIIEKVRNADLILWAYGVYVCLVPAQMKRFIELVIQRAPEAFAGKFAAVFTTSIHFFDHTSHNYMRAICDDLNMKFVGAHSAEMDDLRKDRWRKKLVDFAATIVENAKSDIYSPRQFPPAPPVTLQYQPGSEPAVTDPGNKKITILTDLDDSQTNLKAMIERMQQAFGGKAETINLHDIEIKGGCLGCLQCAYDNQCVYGNKDGYIEFFNQRLRKSYILIYAGAITDRYLSSRWKMFFDRAFFWNHVPSLQEKQFGFLISGPFSHNPNLREIFSGYYQLQDSNVVDFITDEAPDSATLDKQIDNLARRLVSLSEKGYRMPPNFLGVGGKKIFRDDIWGRLRFVFQADHRWYKNNNVYDFPQRKILLRIVNPILSALFMIRPIRKEVDKRMITGMVAPYKKFVRGKPE